MTNGGSSPRYKSPGKRVNYQHSEVHTNTQITNINQNSIQVKIHPGDKHEIIRLQAKLKELRKGNISSTDMFGPIMASGQ
jgi:hypothetical protein